MDNRIRRSYIPCKVAVARISLLVISGLLVVSDNTSYIAILVEVE